MFNIYKVDKQLREREDAIQKRKHETDLNILIKKKERTNVLSQKYRDRVSEFVTQMAGDPVILNDPYNKTWHQKFDLVDSDDYPIQQISPKHSFLKKRGSHGINTMGVSTYSLQQRTVQTKDPYDRSLIQQGLGPLKLDPVPFRFQIKNEAERLELVRLDQARIDTLPHDVDKKAFNLRLRNEEKELGASSFRMKEFSTIGRLNQMYEESTKVMDCELTRWSPKKRLSLPQATRKYAKKLEQKPSSVQIVEPEELKKEKDKLIQRMILHNRTESEIDTEQVYKKLQRKKEGKQSTVSPDLGHRNYMLPSYHEKTHFKGATQLQMQTNGSLQNDDITLRNKFNLSIRTPAPVPGSSNEDLLTQRAPKVNLAAAQRNIPAKDFVRTVLQNCGEYRLKNQNVVTTERGAGFLRKVSQIHSEDPAATFYGATSQIPQRIFGDTSTNHLKELCANSQRSIAIANQLGAQQASRNPFGGARNYSQVRTQIDSRPDYVDAVSNSSEGNTLDIQRRYKMSILMSSGGIAASEMTKTTEVTPLQTKNNKKQITAQEFDLSTESIGEPIRLNQNSQLEGEDGM